MSAARADAGPRSAHAPIGGPKAWCAADLADAAHWTLRTDTEGTAEAVAEDLRRLSAWAAGQACPEQAYAPGVVPLPALEHLAGRARTQVREGCGVACLRGLDPQLDDATLRLAYLAIGLGIGDALENYGRLFEVRDRGEDYRSSAVPVSMTRESTSFHTDSSARDTLPDEVGLLCLQEARSGGESLVSSAVSAHDRLSAQAPHCLSALYREYCRDVVTPGTERDAERIRDNRFPVFAVDADGALRFRYMRFWIERAHLEIGERLPADAIEAFDRLDALLNDPLLVLRFTLRRGEMLWVDNRSLAHNRTAFVDDPARPRLLVRMWTAARGRKMA